MHSWFVSHLECCWYTRNVTDFCTLILFLETLLKLLISPRSLLEESLKFSKYRIIFSAKRGSLTYYFPTWMPLFLSLDWLLWLGLPTFAFKLLSKWSQLLFFSLLFVIQHYIFEIHLLCWAIFFFFFFILTGHCMGIQQEFIYIPAEIFFTHHFFHYKKRLLWIERIF